MHAVSHIARRICAIKCANPHWYAGTAWFRLNLAMTRCSRSLPCLLVLLAAAGCGSDGSSDHPDTPGGQTGEEGAGCNAVESTNLAWSQRSALGFSADELLNALGAGHQARLTYANGMSTTLTLAIARTSGQVVLEDREYT